MGKKKKYEKYQADQNAIQTFSLSLCSLSLQIGDVMPTISQI